jgi:tetratricopeptide (TPR) repeat protein
MIISVLPLNAGSNAKPALARQLSNFACDVVRNYTGAEVNAINYLVQIDQSPRPRLAHVNVSEDLNEGEMIQQFFQQTGSDKLMDGVLKDIEGRHQVTMRFFSSGQDSAVLEESFDFSDEEIFKPVRRMIEALAAQADATLPDDIKEDSNLFGTTHGTAFAKFLEAHDALQYIEKTQGAVAAEFNPDLAMQALVESAKLDPEWEAPYVTLVQLARSCANYQVGDPAVIESHLRGLIETAPEDPRAQFALGELYQSMGNLDAATTCFEKCIQLDGAEPAFYTRLGMVQGQANMPVNAERNFRKAVELEGDDKPSMDFLAQVLVGTGRAHEVPALWQSMIDANPQNAQAHAKLGIAHWNADQKDESNRAFDRALEVLEDNVIVKRYYAPILVQQGETDRALDFYEDCIDVAPADVPLLIEYCQALDAAGRQFEIAPILKDVLNANPDPNTRAQALAWQTELEQPKRVEAVANAQKKMEADDWDGALRDLKPMRNWLADYWKMWFILASAHNRLNQYVEAEDAAMRCINLFPGFEGGWAELASSLGGQDKNEEAYNAMMAGMQNVQGSFAIAMNLALAAKRLGRDDEARNLSRQLREVSNNAPELQPVFEELER